MMDSLFIFGLAIALLGLGLFLHLKGRSRFPYSPAATTKKAGRFVDSAWLTEEEFEEYIRKQDLEPPGDPERFKLWVRAGTFVVAAVSMKSGDRFFVYKASL